MDIYTFMNSKVRYVSQQLLEYGCMSGSSKHSHWYSPSECQKEATSHARPRLPQVLFRTVRYRQPSQQVKPVMVHINYHPDKLDRARAAYKYFVKGDVTALRAFPGGSEPGS